MNKHVRESLKHWFRMRRWVRKQDPIFFKNYSVMEDKIGESWHSEYCELCNIYFNDLKYSEKYSEEESCTMCPLYKIGKCCWLIDSHWYNVAIAQTWGEWLENSNEMIMALWAVRNYKDGKA